MKKIKLEQLLDVAIAVSKEKNRDKLLELILITAMDITNCDGGTLYIKNGDALDFKLMITKSNGTLKGCSYGTIDLPPVPITRQNVCACAVIDGTLINVEDVYLSSKYDFSGPQKYDSLTGYKTTSMLVIPMENDKDQIIGVLQLINALDENNIIVPFPTECEEIILAFASQTAISLTNMNYAQEVKDLLNSLVGVLSTAIDARTPYNATHTRDMVRYGTNFITWLNLTQQEWTFTENQTRQFILCVWLHDVGKLTTPLEIMDKESRLGRKLCTVLDRFQIIALLGKISLLEGNLTQDDYEKLSRDLAQATVLVTLANNASYLQDAVLNEVALLGDHTYIDDTGEESPWLTEEEIDFLCVRKGTLTPTERAIMENHVVMTSRMLAEVSFSSEYKEVVTWAGQHHEFLDGTGYPLGLTAKDLPRETRLLTILDIFDALTARDRPYKPAMPIKKALGVLNAMAKDGKLDAQILALFEQSCAWEDES